MYVRLAVCKMSQKVLNVSDDILKKNAIRASDKSINFCRGFGLFHGSWIVFRILYHSDMSVKWNFADLARCTCYRSAKICIGVGAQSTLREHQIFVRKICIKNSKMPEFYMILARKIIETPELWYLPEKFTKFPNFTWFLPEICPNFTLIIARKIFFPNFRGARASPCPPFPTPMIIYLLPIGNVPQIFSYKNQFNHQTLWKNFVQVKKCVSEIQKGFAYLQLKRKLIYTG